MLRTVGRIRSARVAGSCVVLIAWLEAACGGDDAASSPEPPLDPGSPVAAACEASRPPTLDDPVDVGTAEALRAAFSAGGEIRLTADIIADAPFSTTQRVVLDGSGYTVSGDGQTHLFVTEGGADLTLMRMTLRDAVNDVSDEEHFSRRSGAAVMMRGEGQGTLSIFDVRFENNEIGERGPGDLRGGALYAFAVPRVEIVGAQFIGNRGSNGGAIGGLGSSFSIINTVFSGNVTTGPGGPETLEGRGGAISLDGLSQNEQTASLEVCGSFFERNEAKHAGGAIAVVTHQWQAATVAIDRSSFVDNRAVEGRGGAIYLLDDESYPREQAPNQARITRSYFAENQALGGGGGLWFLTESGRLQLENTTFYSNRTTATQGMGGGLAVPGGPVDVAHCTFAENFAQFHGGGIQAAEDATVTLTNSLFVDNTSDRDGGWAWFHVNRELEDGGGNMQWLSPGLEIDGNSNLPVAAGAVLDDPQIMSPQDNGGVTRSMALAPSSPAIDAGVQTATRDDQRGEPRSDAPDIGAYEAQ